MLANPWVLSHSLGHDLLNLLGQKSHACVRLWVDLAHWPSLHVYFALLNIFLH